MGNGGIGFRARGDRSPSKNVSMCRVDHQEVAVVGTRYCIVALGADPGAACDVASIVFGDKV